MGIRSEIAWTDVTLQAPHSGSAITLGGPIKLFHAEVNATFASAGLTFESGDFFIPSFMWGIQAIPAGDTPVTLPTDLNDNVWLVVEGGESGTAAATWAPSSDTAAILLSTTIELKWSGQLFLAVDTAIYFTTGLLPGAAGDLVTGGTMTVWST